MKKKSLKRVKRLGVYAKTALSFLARAAAAGIIFTFSGLDAMAEEFTYYNRYSESYVGRRRTYAKKTMHQTVARLRERGYMRVVERGDEVTLRLTPEGRRAVERLRIGEIVITKPRTWDHSWHLVAFDIPEQHKGKREAFRKHLVRLGFIKVEKSLFANPYPCETEIAILAKHLAIGPYVHYIKATSFNGDRRLRSAYELA